MSLPHPQSGKDHERKEDKPSRRGIAWKFVKRTIDITEYRNGKDEVNPAKNRTLGGITDHGRLREPAWFCGPIVRVEWPGGSLKPSFQLEWGCSRCRASCGPAIHDF